MLNRELILYDGTKIYPAYLGSEGRLELLKRFGDRREYMFCGCRASDVKLWYRVSSDARIYPEHKGYSHAPGCIFGGTDRTRFAFQQDAESGETRVFLNFKPSDFSVPYEQSSESSADGPTRQKEKDENRYFSLEKFVRQLNTDTWNERMAAGKGVLSAEYFQVSLFSRLKEIKIDGCKKSLRDCRLESDGYQFFYQPFEGYEIKEKEDGKAYCSLVVKGKDGKEYSWFVYEKTLGIALKKYEAMYGADPREEKEKVIMAGFRYLRHRKGSNTEYRVAGRLCFFKVNRNGVIARSDEELKSLDAISNVLWRSKGSVRYFIADEGESYWGCFEKDGNPHKFVLTAEVGGFDGCRVLQCDMVGGTVSQKELEDFLNL